MLRAPARAPPARWPAACERSEHAPRLEVRIPARANALGNVARAARCLAALERAHPREVSARASRGARCGERRFRGRAHPPEEASRDQVLEPRAVRTGHGRAFFA